MAEKKTGGAKEVPRPPQAKGAGMWKQEIKQVPSRRTSSIEKRMEKAPVKPKTYRPRRHQTKY